MTAAPLSLFFSYSHKDEALRDELGKHLKILEREELIAGWHDRQILPGDEWDHKINTNLETADIILLLVSSDFISSAYCWDIETKRAVELHDSGQACVIPVILRPVDWKSAPFGKLGAVPKDGVPVTSQDQDAAFQFITARIRQVATKLIAKRQQQQAEAQKEAAIAIYRQKYEEFAADGAITPGKNQILKNIQKQQGLTDAEVEAIAQSILKPAASQEKLDSYKEAFLENIRDYGYPLSESSRRDLQQVQNYYNLSDAEVAQIEAPIIAEKEAEYQNQQRLELERQQEEERQRQQALEQQRQLEAQRHEQERQEQQRLPQQQRAASEGSLNPQQTQQSPNAIAASLQEKTDRAEFDVFLCHNSADKEQVKEIGEKLKRMGILPWLDEWELRPGLSWQKALGDQITTIKAAAVFVGKSNFGPWQNAELEAFLSEFIQNERPVIPVLLQNCDQTPVLPIFLKRMMWVDFRKASPDPMSQLIWGITGKKFQQQPIEKEQHQQISQGQQQQPIAQPPQVVDPVQPVITSPTLTPYEFQIGTLRGRIVNKKVESPGFLGFGKKEDIVPEVVYEIDRASGNAQLFVEDLGNGIRLEMVKIPGGTFQMGSPENEESRDSDEGPQHKVTIQSFFMGKFTVTQAQWKAIATLDKVNIDLNPDPSNFKGSDRPVEQISWHEAVEFCDRLSRKTNCKYRLPSEAEWEYACRAGTTTPFHFGETITTDIVNYNGNNTYGSAPEGEYRQKTLPVGSFKIANSFGLYDMHGNVWEWCADHWHENYQGAPTDGSAWITGGDGGRLLRGGSWSIFPWYCRSAGRDRYGADGQDGKVGFRLALSLPGL